MYDRAFVSGKLLLVTLTPHIGLLAVRVSIAKSELLFIIVLGVVIGCCEWVGVISYIVCRFQILSSLRSCLDNGLWSGGDIISSASLSVSSLHAQVMEKFAASGRQIKTGSRQHRAFYSANQTFQKVCLSGIILVPYFHSVDPGLQCGTTEYCKSGIFHWLK